jgi:hypothetical protein
MRMVFNGASLSPGLRLSIGIPRSPDSPDSDDDENDPDLDPRELLDHFCLRYGASFW